MTMSPKNEEKKLDTQLKTIEFIVYPEGRKQTFEDLLKSTGGFGLFQWYALIVLLLPEIPAAFVSFAPVFTQSVPDHWTCSPNMTNNLSNLNDKKLSMAIEWNLICNNSWVSDTILSVQMLGMLIGSIFGSQLSDWFGRKSAYFCVCGLMFLGQAFSAIAPTPFYYAVARLIAGAGLSGFMGISTVYPLEFLPLKWRFLTGSVGPWGIGQILLVVLAYYVREWRKLLWICTISFSFVAFTVPLIPESPRWLLRNKKIESAKKSLQYIATANGKKNFSISDEILQSVAEDENSTSKTRYSYTSFFTEPELKLKTLVLMGIWFSYSLVYFGLSFNVKNLSQSPYWNMFLMGLSDTIGYPLALLINNRIGRRKSLVTFMTLSSSFLVALALLTQVYGNTLNPNVVCTLCVLGKIGIAGARSSARLLTSESYPTEVRTMGYGITGVFAGIGGIIAPQIVFLGTIWWSALPFLTFAIVSVFGAACSLLLPETAGQSLQDSIIKVLHPIQPNPIIKVLPPSPAKTEVNLNII